MDENTRCIVASNLTIAFFSAQERCEPDFEGEWEDAPRRPTISSKQVLTAYHHFLGNLEMPDGSGSDKGK